jgi:hypothetical protein
MRGKGHLGLKDSVTTNVHWPGTFIVEIQKIRYCYFQHSKAYCIVDSMLLLYTIHLFNFTYMCVTDNK